MASLFTTCAISPLEVEAAAEGSAAFTMLDTSSNFKEFATQNSACKLAGSTTGLSLEVEAAAEGSAAFTMLDTSSNFKEFATQNSACKLAGSTTGLPLETKNMKHWILATRPKTLAAGIIPVVLGSSLGATFSTLYILPAIACLAAALGIQIACNFANDAVDALKGTDNEHRIGPTRAVASGAISARTMLIACAIMLGISFLIGLYLSSIGGWPIFVLGLISIFFAYGYTGGPFPLAYLGLGDLFVFLFFGIFAVLGSAYIQIAAADISLSNNETFFLPTAWWLLASAIGLQASAIIAVNNLRDRHGDALAHKRTISVRIGRRWSLVYIACLHLAASAAIAGAAWLMYRDSFYYIAGIAFFGGVALSMGIARRDGAALNPFLGLSAALECICGLSIAYILLF